MNKTLKKVIIHFLRKNWSINFSHLYRYVFILNNSKAVVYFWLIFNFDWNTICIWKKSQFFIHMYCLLMYFMYLDIILLLALQSFLTIWSYIDIFAIWYPPTFMLFSTHSNWLYFIRVAESKAKNFPKLSANS